MIDREDRDFILMWVIRAVGFGLGLFWVSAMLALAYRAFDYMKG